MWLSSISLVGCLLTERGSRSFTEGREIEFPGLPVQRKCCVLKVRMPPLDLRQVIVVNSRPSLHPGQHSLNRCHHAFLAQVQRGEQFLQASHLGLRQNLLAVILLFLGFSCRSLFLPTSADDSAIASAK